jgi:tetratricopeptide (TPR) repeat protein
LSRSVSRRAPRLAWLLLVLALAAGAVARAQEPVRLAILDFAGYPALAVEDGEAVARRASLLFETFFGQQVAVEFVGRYEGLDAFDRFVPARERPDRTGEPARSQVAKLRAGLEQTLKGSRVLGLGALVPDGPVGYRAGEVAERYLARRRALLAELRLAEQPAVLRSLTSLATFERMMRSKAPWDVMLTNMPQLYSPEDGSALHALLRGGLIGGFTIWNNPGKPPGSSMMVTSFTLDSAAAAVTELRGRPPLAPADRTEALVYLVTHELGHMLLRLPDNYDHANCLMRPPLDVNYLDWGRSITAPGCEECRRRGRRGAAIHQAELLGARGDVTGALARWREAVEGPPEAGLYNNFAWFCAERSINLAEAWQFARRAVELAPENPSFLDTLGWVEFRRGRPSEARVALEQALRHASRREDRSVVLYHLAVARAALEGPAVVRPLLEEALKLGLSGGDATQARKLLSGAR